MGLSIQWLVQFIDALIDGDAKEEAEEYDCTEMTWRVFKVYAFFLKKNLVSDLSKYNVGL